ncbi:MAG: radical SAM protein [Thermoproteota archaeon]
MRVIRATPHLESVLLYVTNSCNLNCIHCCVNASKRVKNELSTNEAKHLINDLSYAGVYELAISGGEPLMRVDFFDICSYAKHKIPSLILFTNGTLIDEEKAKKIADINFSEVAVSLYGSSSISHEFITNVQGSFNRTIEGIIRLTSNGINVKINVVVSEHNANELENITKLAVELKAKSIIFSPVDKVGRAIINWRKFGDQEKTLRNIFLFLKKRSYGV